MKKYWAIFALLILLTSCSGAPSDETIQTAIAQTSEADLLVEEVREPTQEPEPTETTTLTKTPKPTSTPKPTNTTRPTNTPTTEPTPGIPNTISKNFIASQEDNDIIVEIGRILIAQKEGFPDEFDYPIFEDKTTLVMFIFKITNNTQQVVKMNFHTGTAALNGEQIDFGDYWWESRLRGDDLTGDILPGSTVVGGFYAGIKRSMWDEIETIVISVPHAFDKSYSRVTGDFLFTVDVENWTFEPLPDEF